MNKIIVLQGVPASGKSTWAKDFVKENQNYVIVSRDSIREARGTYWIKSQEDYISDVEEFQIKAAIKRKLNVIIDATNLNPKTIAKWNHIASELNCEVEYKKFEIEYKEALQRDKQRIADGKRGVGEKTLKDFFRRYFPEKLNSENIDKRIIKEPTDLPKCIICDIDGTIALRTGRSPFDWSKVGEDNVDPRMQQLLTIIGTNFPDDIQIMFFSGREETEECYDNTLNWLCDNFPISWSLTMRKKGDYRKDSIVKKEMYEEYVKDKYDVLCVFDDRDQVVDMWRELGLLCCQVYYGDF